MSGRSNNRYATPLAGLLNLGYGLPFDFILKLIVDNSKVNMNG